MLAFLPGPILGVLTFILYILNSIFFTIPLIPAVVLKLIIPFKFWKSFWNKVLNFIAESWIRLNNLNMSLTKKINWDISGFEEAELSMDEWYLVIANHQCWLDVLVLQKIFIGKIPFLKCFIKQELFWLPVFGITWWAMDYPFVKRYTRQHLLKHPEDKGRDIEITKKACEKFKYFPTAVINFVEGTRYTDAKRDIQKSAFKNLLMPKAGGVSLVMDIMGDSLNKIVDVTIAYPQGIRSSWGFLTGKITDIRIKVEALPVPKDIIRLYTGIDEDQKKIHDWLNGIWLNKDRKLSAMQGNA